MRIASERSNSVVRAHYAEATLAASRGLVPSLDVVPCAFAHTGPAPEQSKRSATAEIEGIAARRLDENRSLRRLAVDSINGVRAAAHSIQSTLPGSSKAVPPPSLGVRDLFYVSAALAAQSTPYYSLADAKHPAPLALARASKAIEASAAALQSARTREANKHTEDLARANILVSDRAAEAALRDFLALNPQAGSTRGKGALPASDDAGRLRTQEPSSADLERKLVAALTRTQELEAENAALLAAGFSTEPAAPSPAAQFSNEALEAERKELQERLHAADAAADAAELERRRLESERRALEEQRRKEQMATAASDKAARAAPRVVRLIAPGAMEEEAAFNLAKARGDFLHVTDGSMAPPRSEAHTRVRAAPSEADTSTSSRRSRASVGNTSSASMSSTATSSRSTRSQHASYGVVASEGNVVIYGPLAPRIRRRAGAASASGAADSSIASTGTRSRPRAPVASSNTSVNLTRSERNIVANVQHVLRREERDESFVAEPIPARVREHLGMSAEQEEEAQPLQEPEPQPQQPRRSVGIFDVDDNVAELLRQLGSGSSSSAARRAPAPAPASAPAELSSDVVMQDASSSSSSRKRSFEALETEDQPASSSSAPDSGAKRSTRSSAEGPSSSSASSAPEPSKEKRQPTARRGVGAPTASSLARAAEAKAARDARTPAAGKLLKSSAAGAGSNNAGRTPAPAAASGASGTAARKKPRLALAPAAALANQEEAASAAAMSKGKGKARAEGVGENGERPVPAARRMREGRV